jgi:hypothetical protein
VPKVQRLPALIAGAAAGALAAAVLLRRRRPPERPAPADADPRADELRRKLAEARQASAEEDEVEAAERISETTVEEAPAPPADEFEAMRRRVHEEAQRAAEEMKESGEDS